MIPCTLLGLALLPALPSPAAPVAKDPPPNVLLIYVDDLNMDLGTYGHPVVQTPNIDSIAARGVRFDNAYCPFPVCNPSRVSVIWGQRPTSTGIWLNETAPYEQTHIRGAPALPILFGQQGYFTAAGGKVLHSRLHGVDLWDEQEWIWDDPWVEKPENPTPDDDPNCIYWGPFMNGPDESLGWMTDHYVTDRTLDRLDRVTEPFFIAAGFKAPHKPFIYPEKYDGLYDPLLDVPELPPEESDDDWKDGVPDWVYRTITYLDPNYDSDPELGRREATVAYWRTISFVDHEIGEILAKLDETGLADRTIVVFLSDHGFSLGHHQRFAKFSPFDQSLRAPLIISVPWMESTHGTACARPVQQVDLYPTLADLCGISEPPDLDGRSLTPLLEDPGQPWEPAFSHLQTNWGVKEQRIVITDDTKLAYLHDGNHLLYDRVADPGEYRNLYVEAGNEQRYEDSMDLLVQAGLLQASSSNFGPTSLGTTGPVGLSLDGPLVLGEVVKLIADNSSGVGSPGLVMFGWGGRYWPGFGGWMAVNPVITLLQSFPAQGLEWEFLIPDDGILLGEQGAFQTLQVDPLSPGGLIYSRALRVFFWDR